MTIEGSVLVATWIAIVLLALAMSGIVRQLRVLTFAMGQGRVGPTSLLGRVVPHLRTERGDGWRPNKPSVLLFATSECDVCRDRLRELEAVARRDRGKIAFGAVFKDAPEGFGSDTLQVLAENGDAFEELGLPVTPFGIVVSTEGRVAYARAAGSSAAIEELVRAARAAA